MGCSSGTALLLPSSAALFSCRITMLTANLSGGVIDDVMDTLKDSLRDTLRDSDIHSPDRIYHRSYTW